MSGNRRDANHKEIVETLRSVGAFVLDLANWAGAGFDLLVFYREQIYVMEIKDGEDKRERLTTKERATMVEIERRDCHYDVVCSVDEALKLIGVRE